jgi:hypothetical protein
MRSLTLKCVLIVQVAMVVPVQVHIHSTHLVITVICHL